MSTMRPWRVGALALFALALMGGCDQPADLPAQQLCDAVCDCEAPLPQEHAQCTSACITEVGTTAIPDTCLDCLDEPLCTLRETCIRACTPQTGGTP